MGPKKKMAHFQQYFSEMVAVSFIGGGNQSTQRKPTFHKSLTNFITYCCIEYTRGIWTRNRSWWFSSGTPVSSTNKTDCHDITKILLKVALKLHQPKKGVMVFNATFKQYFSYIVAISFIDKGNWSSWRKPPSWISDRHKKPKLFRGPSNDYSWAVWFQLSMWFKRRSVVKHFSHRVQS